MFITKFAYKFIRSATKAADTIACRVALHAVRVLINWELAWSRDSTAQVAEAPWSTGPHPAGCAQRGPATTPVKRRNPEGAAFSLYCSGACYGYQAALIRTHTPIFVVRWK